MSCMDATSEMNLKVRLPRQYARVDLFLERGDRKMITPVYFYYCMLLVIEHHAYFKPW